MNGVQGKTSRDYLGDIGIFGIVHLLLPLTGIIVLTLITKFLGVEDYGIYSLAITTIGILIYLVHLMFPSGLARFLSGEKDGKVISSTFISAILLILLAEAVVALITLSLSDVIASKIFHDINAKVYLYIIVAVVLFEASSRTLFTYFRILEQVKRYLKYEILYEVIRIGFIAVAVFFGRDILFVLSALLLSRMVIVVLFLAILLKEQGWTSPSLKIVKPYLAFGIPLIVPQLMTWVISLSDRYFISYFWGATQVGIYSAAYSLPPFIGGINDAIWFVLLPVVFRLWNAGLHEEARKHFTQAIKLFVIVGIPASFGIILLAEPALTIVSTKEIGVQSWQVVPWISLSQIAYVIYGYGAQIYLIQRKTKPVALFVTTAAIVNAIGNFLLIPKYGILGAAIATLIAYLTMATISISTARRYFTFPVEWTLVYKAILASVVMSAFIWFFRSPQIWQVLLSISAGVVIYFTVLLLTKSFSREEVETVKRFFTLRHKE